MKSINEIIEGYNDATGLRCTLQSISGLLTDSAGLPPVIGTLYTVLDTFITAKATDLYKKRVDELLANISGRITELDDVKVNKAHLESEEFFETFLIGINIATESADEEKRQLVADYLVGKAAVNEADDETDPYGNQVLKDLKTLSLFHLKILKVLPESLSGVNMMNPPPALHDMPLPLYQKGMSDLAQLGFIQFESDGGAINGGGGVWKTTPYLKVFRLSVSGQPGSLWNCNPNFDRLFTANSDQSENG